MSAEWVLAGLAIVALMAMVAAVWLLERGRDLDQQHIDQAMELVNAARQRHPASRGVCPACGCGVIGPMREHVCAGAS